MQSLDLIEIGHCLHSIWRGLERLALFDEAKVMDPAIGGSRRYRHILLRKPHQYGYE
jgi:hypothetical protein